MKNLIFSIILLLFFSGIKMPNSIISKSNAKYLTINCENIMSSKKIVNLSQIASDVKYIILETNPSCLINNLSRTKFFFADSLIFVQNVNHILKFSIQGKFIKQIVNPGRGPGEIGIINSVSVISDKRLLAIHYRNKLMFFSFNGDLIKSVAIPYHQEVKALNDRTYISYDPGTNGSEKYNFILANDKGDTLSFVKNNTTWKKSYSGSIVVKSAANEAFYSTNDTYFFKSKYNDTVYQVNNAMDKIEPSYVLNFGKYKVPEEMVPEKILSDPIKLQDYWKKAVDFYLGRPLEASNKIFIKASCMGKREYKYLIYDKKSHEGCLLINENKESSGILNDWDGGLDFWPTMQKSTYELAMPMDVLELKKRLNVETYWGKGIINPDKQKSFKRIVSSLNETDNPIIMIVTLRK